MSLDVIVGILLCAAVVIVMYAVCSYPMYRRTSKVKAIASKLNLEFSDFGFSPLFPEKIHLFSKGHDRRFSNVLRGIQGNMEVHIFDYHYGPPGSGYKGWPGYTVVVIRMQTLRIPEFSIVPRSVFYPLLRLFQDKGIKFDKSPGFAKSYLLQSSDERHIRLLFHHSVRFFYQFRKDVCTEGFGNTLVYYRAKGCLAPKHWPTLLKDAQELAHLLNQ
ncbi:MAG: hypothetical protein AAFW75_03755 [Cyanobacteria bacterium J06636_16]